MFWEREDNENSLDWHFIDGFSDECWQEENRERDLKMTTCESGHVKQWIRNLQKLRFD